MFSAQISRRAPALLTFRLAWFRVVVVGLALCAGRAFGDDGYRLWLRYEQVSDAALRQTYAAAISEIVISETPLTTGGFGALGAGLRSRRRPALAV